MQLATNLCMLLLIKANVLLSSLTYLRDLVLQIKRYMHDTGLEICIKWIYIKSREYSKGSEALHQFLNAQLKNCTQLLVKFPKDKQQHMQQRMIVMFRN